ncbi:hypothetical protein IGI04_026176, partial [Brassica rapa subsp. trilocularis]
MAGDQKGELSKKGKLFLEEFTDSLDKACKDQIRSRSTGVIGLPSKTTSWFCEEDIKKLSQVIMDVEKQFRETHTTRPSLEEQNQELITSVSELNSAEPVSATSIQGDQAKESSAAIQKDEQPVQNVMVPFKQAIVPEETPREPQTACKKRQLIVFDPCDFQKTFLGVFLFNPFVWNKTKAVELSRHELGMEHVVFEPGGELWNHRNNPLVIEKKSAATTIVFGDLLPSEAKGMHVSAQQEFNYENNWRMLPTLSWIQQTRKRSKWPPDHQDIVNSAKHIGLAKFCELLISDWAGRLQIYLWISGAFDSTLIILGECSARARTSLGNKELEADQNALLLDHVKVWKPPDLQKLQYHFRDCQIKSEHAKVTNHVFKSSFIDYTDMMHLFLPKESCADYMEALKNAKRKNKREEDKRFKPPDLSQERHQDVTYFILIKEAPPDAAYKPKPRKDNFGIRLLLYDDFAC